MPGALPAMQSFLRAPAVPVQRAEECCLYQHSFPACAALRKKHSGTRKPLCAYWWALPNNSVEFQHEANGMGPIFAKFLAY